MLVCCFMVADLYKHPSCYPNISWNILLSLKLKKIISPWKLGLNAIPPPLCHHFFYGKLLTPNGKRFFGDMRHGPFRSVYGPFRSVYGPFRSVELLERLVFRRQPATSSSTAKTSGNQRFFSGDFSGWKPKCRRRNGHLYGCFQKYGKTPKSSICT